MEEADLEQFAAVTPVPTESGEFAPADDLSAAHLPAADHVTPTHVPFRAFP